MAEESDSQGLGGRLEVLVLLSGGIDSACVLGFYKQMGRSVGTLFVDYGQPAAKAEAAAAREIASHYGTRLTSCCWAGSSPKTAGLTSGRNSFLASAALMEAPPSVRALALGIHAGTAYGDCSAVFLEAMQTVLDASDASHVKLVAPFLRWTKPEILAYAELTHVPVSLTYSCEQGGPEPCARCDSCLDRIRAYGIS